MLFVGIAALIVVGCVWFYEGVRGMLAGNGFGFYGIAYGGAALASGWLLWLLMKRR